MKGQRLFVRETTPEDAGPLAEFYASESTSVPPEVTGSAGLVGRLVGSIVAHMIWEIDQNHAAITHICVANGLRRKRIGRSLVTEAVRIARKKDIIRLTVNDGCPAREFFLRTGFATDGGVLFLEVN